MSGKAVVQTIWITFKRINSAMKLALLYLKNVFVWNTYAIKRAYQHRFCRQSHSHSVA